MCQTLYTKSLYLISKGIFRLSLKIIANLSLTYAGAGHVNELQEYFGSSLLILPSSVTLRSLTKPLDLG